MSKIFKLCSVKATSIRILQTGHLTPKKVTISEIWYFLAGILPKNKSLDQIETKIENFIADFNQCIVQDMKQTSQLEWISTYPRRKTGIFSASTYS